MTDKPMTVGDLIDILKVLDKDTPVLVNHHCAVLLYKIECVKIIKIKGKNHLIIFPDDASEEMYSLEGV